MDHYEFHTFRHRLQKTQKQLSELLASDMQKYARPKVDADNVDYKFETLRTLLKERKGGVHPIKMYSEVPGIKNLGISQDHFSSWYHCWLSQRKFKGTGKTERNALDLILEYYSSHMEK